MIDTTRNWLREQLFMCFESPHNTIRFVEEKRRMTNGKLYKYCPIYDSGRTDVMQYSIENLKNSIIYMSRIAHFNDPFDSYAGLSFDEIMRGFLPSMLERSTQMNFDHKTSQVLPDVFKMLLNADKPQQESNRLVIKYFMQCVKQKPEILMGQFDPEVFQTDYLQLILSDLATGVITLEELSSLPDMKDIKEGGLLAELMREMMQSPQLLRVIGMRIFHSQASIPMLHCGHFYKYHISIPSPVKYFLLNR